jgi:hypothetical protein
MAIRSIILPTSSSADILLTSTRVLVDEAETDAASRAKSRHSQELPAITLQVSVRERRHQKVAMANSSQAVGARGLDVL